MKFWAFLGFAALLLPSASLSANTNYNDRTIDFLLYDWLKAEDLTGRSRFSDHSRETFDAVLDTCERIAREKYAPFNRTLDIEEPRFDGEKVILPQATHDAHKAFVESGMLSAAQDYEIGGMQLPYTVEAAANAFLRQRFWPAFNKRFQVAARNAAEAHSPAPAKLDEIFSWEKERTVTNDWTARWGGQVFQIALFIVVAHGSSGFCLKASARREVWSS